MAKASAAGRNKDPAGTALDLRGSGLTQYRVPQGYCAEYPGCGTQCRSRDIWHSGRREPAHSSRTIFDPEIGSIRSWLPNFGDCLQFGGAGVTGKRTSGAIVLNSDSPTLPTGLLIEAAETARSTGRPRRARTRRRRRLLSSRVKKAHRRMFDNIEWSTSRVADQTIDRAQEHRASHACSVAMVRCRRCRRIERCCTESLLAAARSIQLYGLTTPLIRRS